MASFVNGVVVFWMLELALHIPKQLVSHKLFQKQIIWVTLDGARSFGKILTCSWSKETKNNIREFSNIVAKFLTHPLPPFLFFASG